MEQKKIIIGCPHSPLKRIATEEIPVTKVLITYGGGMGGSSGTYYATRRSDISDKKIKILTIDGRIIDIGTNFIVTEEDVIIVKNQYERPDTTTFYTYNVISKNMKYELIEGYSTNRTIKDAEDKTRLHL